MLTHIFIINPSLGDWMALHMDLSNNLECEMYRTFIKIPPWGKLYSVGYACLSGYFKYIRYGSNTIKKTI